MAGGKAVGAQAVDEFLLEGSPKALHAGVIIAGAHASHALLQTVSGQALRNTELVN